MSASFASAFEAGHRPCPVVKVQPNQPIPLDESPVRVEGLFDPGWRAEQLNKLLEHSRANLSGLMQRRPDTDHCRTDGNQSNAADRCGRSRRSFAHSSNACKTVHPPSPMRSSPRKLWMARTTSCASTISTKTPTNNGARPNPAEG